MCRWKIQIAKHTALEIIYGSYLKQKPLNKPKSPVAFIFTKGLTNGNGNIDNSSLCSFLYEVETENVKLAGLLGVSNLTEKTMLHVPYFPEY